MSLQNLSVSDAAVKVPVTPSAPSVADSVQNNEGSFLQELKELIWDSEPVSEPEQAKVQDQQVKSVDSSEKTSEETETAEVKDTVLETEEAEVNTEKTAQDEKNLDVASSDSERSSAMAEGNEVLNRLNEANNTLTKGKSLPQSPKTEQGETNSIVMTSVTPESSPTQELAEAGTASVVASSAGAGKGVNRIDSSDSLASEPLVDGVPVKTSMSNNIAAQGSSESQDVALEGSETPLTAASIAAVSIAKDVDSPSSLQRPVSNLANSPAPVSVTPESLPSQELSAKDLQAANVAQGSMGKLNAQATAPVALEKGQIDIAALGMTPVEHKEALDATSKPLPDGLNQQLSALAGLQGAQTLQQTRAEQQIQAQAIQQTPLQLTREQATEKLSERINLMLSKNLKHVDIRLDPPELGRMQIRLSMNNDQASVQFTVANGQARDVVDQAMPRLREMMLQQGIQLADTNVQQQSSGQSQQGYADNNRHGDGQYANESHLEDEHQATELSVEVEQPKQGISFYA